MTAPIERGVVVADGTWFSPASRYAYAISDASGRAHASGEFSVVSSSTRNDLLELTQQRVSAGMPDSMAWQDTLLSNGLEWDAIQLSNNPVGQK